MIDDDVLARLVHGRWQEYARPRFVRGEVREQRAFAEFMAITQQRYGDRAEAADVAAEPVNYTAWHLRLAVLQALEQECRYCRKLFGLESWGLVYATPPDRGLPNVHALRNVAVCCARCAQAKGMLAEHEWIDLLSALRIAENRAADNVIDRLIAGAGAAATQKVLPPHPAPRVTREGRGSARKNRKK